MDLRLHGSLTRVLLIEDTSHVGHARRTAQRFAEQLGLDETDAGRVALAVTELASNMLKHAGSGELHLRKLPGDPEGVEVIASDRGRGFNIQDCISDGFSMRGAQGTGLGAIVRQAQVFDVHSDSRGTVLLTRFYPQSEVFKDLRIGGSQHSLYSDPACGDVWEVAITDQQISVLVIDGMGHGPDAEHAASSGPVAFRLAPFAGPEVVLDDIHHEMQGTRGGAVAIAEYHSENARLRFIGIGHIGATLIRGGTSRGIASHPGIVGLQFRRIPSSEYQACDRQLLIMYSDGLQSRWKLPDYPGLRYRHPAIISAVLYRDFCRGKDDVTVIVIALESFDD